MPSYDSPEGQRWARPGLDGDVDRAFLEDLLHRQEQLALAREKRLERTLQLLPIAWTLIAVAIGLALGVLYFAFQRFLGS